MRAKVESPEVEPLEFSDAPYPGLRPFRTQEADIFFGRDRQIDQLLERLAHHRFLAVTGPSGCGKSSLVKAGMIPALNAGFMVKAGSRWRIASLRPGEHPIARLAHAVATPEVLGEYRASEVGLPLVEAALRRGPLGLVDLLRTSTALQGANLLVLVDQFEELFRFRERIDPDEADAFVRLLLEPTKQLDVPAYVVITMRSEYLGDCTVFHGLPEAINDGQYLTPRLTRDECCEAICGPARVFHGEVEPLLVNRLLNEFGPDPDELPLLQHALGRMWSSTGSAASATDGRRLTVATYEGIGGREEAVTRHVDEAYHALGDAGRRAIADVLFRTLSEGGPGKDARQPTPLAVVAGHAGATIEETDAVARLLEAPEFGFITISRRSRPERGDARADGEDVLDLAHESLIRLWPRLRDRPGRLGQQRVWSKESLSGWIGSKAHEFYVRRANEWHASRGQEEILRLYCDEVPLDLRMREARRDEHQAEVYFAADVLDGRFGLTENLGAESYWRLEGVWLREVKELKAYFQWKQRGGWGLDGCRQDYLAACDEILRLLGDWRLKAPSAAFTPIQRYLREGSAGGRPRLDLARTRNAKARRLRDLGVAADESRRWADAHLERFYGGITRAAADPQDEVSTRQVLEGLGVVRGHERHEAIVDCFEAAVAIQFLGPNAVTRILQEEAQARRSDRAA